LADRGYDVVIASAGDRLTGAAGDTRSHGYQVIEVNATIYGLFPDLIMMETFGFVALNPVSNSPKTAWVAWR
jgi:hypothetical protein